MLSNFVVFKYRDHLTILLHTTVVQCCIIILTQHLLMFSLLDSEYSRCSNIGVSQPRINQQGCMFMQSVLQQFDQSFIFLPDLGSLGRDRLG